MGKCFRHLGRAPLIGESVLIQYDSEDGLVSVEGIVLDIDSNMGTMKLECEGEYMRGKIIDVDTVMQVVGEIQIWTKR